MGSVLSRILRDISFLSKMVPALMAVRRVGKQVGPGEWSVVSFWDEAVARGRNNFALRQGAQRLTFGAVDDAANQLARAALSAGLKEGETIGIYMPNCIDYIVVVLGMAKIGVTCALLNTNVTGSSLVHCIKECSVSKLFCSTNTADAVESLQNICEIFIVGPSGQAPFGKALEYQNSSNEPIPKSHRSSVAAMSPFLHIFTSGTTGLPKGARINHLRFFGSSLIFAKLLKLRADDCIYCPLPFYHSSAIVLGLGLSWHCGAEFSFRDKFSAREFWSDCVLYQATVIQYIGELCRYLVNTAPGPDDVAHKVRMAIGNGLRADVWERFQKRFQIPQIAEFYAATEGNFGFVNTENKVGAVGFLSPLIKSKHPGKILRFDWEKGEPLRDANGRCVECAPGEVGELVGMIDTEDVTRRFDGYTDRAATEKKVLRGVLGAGDMCFRSGDLLAMDGDGYLYFQDRVGDTLRWKGENVSTTEVENVITAALSESCEECVVYGVTVPGCEGRAAMALVRPGPGFDPALLFAALADSLPDYARPCFLRVSDGDVEVTGTYKHRKMGLVEAGFEPAEVAGAGSLWFRDQSAFVPLDRELYARIAAGRIRL